METTKSKIVKYFLALIAIVLFVPLWGCGENHQDHEQMAEKETQAKVDSSIIRTGAIDLEMIDTNKDGKVYQDPMDWNVISDKAGICPLCKMTLEEVTIAEAKDNLVKSGFEVK